MAEHSVTDDDIAPLTDEEIEARLAEVREAVELGDTIIPAGSLKPTRLRRRLFAVAYAATTDVARASAFAGFTRARPALLKDPYVKQLVAEEAIAREVRTRVTGDRILHDQLLVLDMAIGRREQVRTHVETLEDDEGTPYRHLTVEEYRETNLQAANNALERLGKHLKLFNDTVDLNVRMPELILNLGGPAEASEPLEGEATRVDDESDRPAGPRPATFTLGPAADPEDGFDPDTADWLN